MKIKVDTLESDLGIFIGHDTKGCYNENWLIKINKMKNCLHVWKSRKLSVC